VAYSTASLTGISTHSPSRLRAALAKTTLKAAFSAAMVGCVLGAGQAQAIVVKVGGQFWNVTTFTGSYSANITKFNTAANGGMMPWWPTQSPPNASSSTLANTFALAVGSGLGFINFGGATGPLFAYQQPGVGGNPNVQSQVAQAPTGTTTFNAGILPNVVGTYAQATLTSVPGPLPVLGAAAAFGFSRKLRKRINDSKAVGSAFPAA
jgi:hypothetical protein